MMEGHIAMRTYYRNISEVLKAPLTQAANVFHRRDHSQNRVLRSTRLEDSVYAELRKGDDDLEELERACGAKLSSFPDLSRDIYQSFYSLNVRRYEDADLSETAKRFNSPILDEVMHGEDYPAIKAACEGRQIPAYEAAGEFISQVADDLDDLLEKTCGQKKSLDTLERLEQRRQQSMERLRDLLEQMKRDGQTPELENQVLAAANQAQNQSNQADAVGRMMRDSLVKNKAAISALVAQASSAAAQKAEDTATALMAWGCGPDQHDAKRERADMDLAARVRQNKTLLDISRHLGRLKELMDGKRKNGYAYGRGEKYSLELGGSLDRALSSEFAMLASPQTAPLFLRKLQRKSLKQYQRREPVSKGGGDIICMLDESGSARGEAPWCKAVALALLDIAARDGRRFAMIHFAGEDHFQTDLFLPGQYDREDMLRAAETFLDGNTDYQTPLREALRLMAEEGFENADMVFITDGQCALPEDFLSRLKAQQDARAFRVTGILLDQQSAGFEFSLKPFCTEIYRTSQLARDEIAQRLVLGRV